MPHLLHSVVLATSPQVLCFIDSILLQKELAASCSPLALDYPTLVRRFWSSECWEALMEDESDYWIDYGALYEVIRGVDSLGLHFRSLHLLYNGLASSEADPLKDWKCRHVTFAGSLPRWNPITSAAAGRSFLSRITHLTLWIPPHSYPWLPAPPYESPVPTWVAEIPFSSLPNLTHLAFPLLSKHIPTADKATPMVFQVPTETLVYVAPGPPEDFNPAVFREWAVGNDPLSHGVVTPFHALPSCRAGNREMGWEFPFTWGESDYAWTEVDHLARRADVDRNMDIDGK